MCSAGAGLPYFSTDTVAAQRALEIRADDVKVWLLFAWFVVAGVVWLSKLLSTRGRSTQATRRDENTHLLPPPQGNGSDRSSEGGLDIQYERGHPSPQQIVNRCHH